MNYWMFKCNPKYYRIADRLSDPEPVITWTAPRHRRRIAAGDVAFVVLTRPHRSLVAVLEVTAPPRFMAESASERKYSIGTDLTEKWRLTARIVDRPESIDGAAIEAAPGLGDLAAFRRSSQGTDFPVTADQGRRLQSLIGTRSPRRRGATAAG